MPDVERRALRRRLQLAVIAFFAFWGLAFLTAGAVRAEGPRVSLIGLVLLLVAVVTNANRRSKSPEPTAHEEPPPVDAPQD